MAFHQKFTKLHGNIVDNVPKDLDVFVENVVDQIKPFIKYKREQDKAQRTGELRSLVWPLFFDHTRREAERWVARLEDVRKGKVAYRRAEVVTFWTGIMDEHARFVAHLLDPDEYETHRHGHED